MFAWPLSVSYSVCIPFLIIWIVLSPVPLIPFHSCFCCLSSQKLPSLRQWHNLHSLLLEPRSWILLESLKYLKNLISPEIHGGQPLLSSQLAIKSFYLFLVTPLSILIFLFLILYFDTRLNCNSLRDLTWAVLSVCNAFLPSFSLFTYSNFIHSKITELNLRYLLATLQDLFWAAVLTLFHSSV